MTDNLKKEFWERLEDTRTGMLASGAARAIPMTHYIDDENDAPVLWFITAKGTDLAEAAVGGAKAEYLVSSKDESLYARIEGEVRRSEDMAQLDRIWNRVAGAWFDDGKRDDDVQLIRMDLREAEVWITGGRLKFLYEIAKAQSSGVKPDIGEHQIIRF
ncbi:pyridoxamine 5'-phosphate oxidase family protein [Sulfitobacter aestuarii]|uniref:Pyridoxamine 5'-phosphate oxidase family protein n=1 Tax=Sulfitobacter aestuarii TaxID=2161676 RepID=A0ABW5TZE3_9RHOB